MTTDTLTHAPTELLRERTREALLRAFGTDPEELHRLNRIADTAARDELLRTITILELRGY